MISDRGLGETSHVLFRDRRCEFPIGPPLSLFATLSGSGSVAEVPVLSTPVNFCTGIQALLINKCKFRNWEQMWGPSGNIGAVRSHKSY